MTIPEQLTANFYRWEGRGRGVQLFDAPVELEPPFVPFPGHRVVLDGPVDAGRKESVFSKLAGKVFTALQAPKVEVAATREMAVKEAEQPEVYWFGKEEEPLYEFTVRLPSSVSYGAEARLFDGSTKCDRAGHPAATRCDHIAGHKRQSASGTKA